MHWEPLILNYEILFHHIANILQEYYTSNIKDCEEARYEITQIMSKAWSFYVLCFSLD